MTIPSESSLRIYVYIHLFRAPLNTAHYIRRDIFVFYSQLKSHTKPLQIAKLVEIHGKLCIPFLGFKSWPNWIAKCLASIRLSLLKMETGGNGKREEGNVCINGEEEGEEQKMEQFFGLIKRFHEARDRRRAELEEKVQQQKKRKTRMATKEEEHSSWVPRFEWEDFTQEIEFKKTPLVFPNATTPCNQKHDKKQEKEDDGLSLKLAL